MGWPTVKLGKICRIELGKTPSRGDKTLWDQDKKDSNIWLSIADLPHSLKPVVTDSKEYITNKGANLCKVIPAGTLIVSFKLSLGRLAYTGTDLFSNEAIASLYIEENVELANDYLYWALTNFDWDKAVGSDIKVKGKTLNKAKLKEIDIPFPPLTEQQRVVAILDQAFADIERARANAEQNLKNARELFDSYLHQAFKPQGEGWTDKKLADVLLSNPRNGWSPPAKNHADTGTPVLTLSAVTGFEFKLSKIKYTSAPTKKGASYWVNNGDVLMTRSNTTNLVGHVAIAAGITTPTVYPDIIIKLSIDKNSVDSKYLYYQLRSPKLRAIISASARGANPTMKKINQEMIKNFPIVITSLSRQKEIATSLEQLSCETKRLETLCKERIRKLDELKKSLLQRVFSGEFTKNKGTAA